MLPSSGDYMATRLEIETLISYVIGEENRQQLIKSGLDGVPAESRARALRGLQDLGWIGPSGTADFEMSYSLTKEGRRICTETPPVTDLEKCAQKHVEGLRLAESRESSTRRKGLRQLIEIECEMGNWDSALMNCYELRKSAERDRDIDSLAAALYHEGMVEVAQNKWDEALESYLDSIEKYMEIGDRRGVCEINRAMGVIYGNKGDYVSALRCFDNSLTMALEIDDKDLQAKAQGNLAIIYDLQGRLDESERANEHCLSYFLENGDLSNAARAANNLGVLNLTKERFQVSAEYFDKTIHAGRNLMRKEVLARGLVNGGYCYARLGQTGRALQYTDEAISLLKEPNDMNMLALAYRNYGYIESKSSNMEKGAHWFEKSVRLAKASGVEDTYAACCYEYGMALIRSTVNLGLAKKLMKRAAAVYRDIGNIDFAKRVESRTPSL